MQKFGALLLAIVVALAASGCGGGSARSAQGLADSGRPEGLSRQPGVADSSVQAQFQAAARVKRPLAAPGNMGSVTAQVDPFGGGDPIQMVDRLFTEIAEVSFTQFFSPAPQPSQEADIWRYRYYPETDSFVGVPVKQALNDAGGLLRDGIYVMGGSKKRQDGSRVSPFAEQPLFVGMRVMDFVPANPVAVVMCPSNQWRVNGTCAAMVPDFALEFDLESIQAVDGSFENVRFAIGRNNGSAAVFPPQGYNFPVYLKIPNRPSLQFTNEVTIDFWVKMDSSLLESWWNDPNQPAYSLELISKTENETGLRIFAGPNPDRTVAARQRVLYGALFSVPNTIQQFNGGTYGPLDEWTRVTVTQSNVDGFKFYLNRVLTGANPHHRGDFTEINRSDLFVGGGSPAPVFGRAAWIQSLKIYKRAMTEGEVARLN